MDCEREPPKIAEGAMRLVLRMDYHQLLSNLTSFLRDVCRTILIIICDFRFLC